MKYIFNLNCLYQLEISETSKILSALLKLSEEVDYTDYVQPICLPDIESLLKETFLGIKCVAVGWGMRLHGARLENTLKEILVPVVENIHCSKMYGMLHNVPVESYHICAGPLRDGGIGTCVVSKHVQSCMHIVYLFKFILINTILDL